jgi:predicted anti-sigma-YlaC factor YlaD
MNETNCEITRQAAMALADGEIASLNTAQVRAHLAECQECQRAAAQLQSLNRLLAAQSRRVPIVDFWSRVEGRLAASATKTESSSLGMCAILVLMLLLVRIMVLSVAQPLELGVRFVAVFFVLGWFFVLRENPFAIQPHLGEPNNYQP